MTVLVVSVVIPQLGIAPSYLNEWTNVITLLAFGGIPVAAGIAILRYHLYDIDLIINRTLVYGIVTGVLGLVYYGIVILAQQLVSDRIAASEVVVAGSTLTVAALFSPVRKRIQELVDRRFNRRKYNARRTIEVFGARVRDDVDIDSLTRHLIDVVNETMEPSHVRLWLKSMPATVAATAFVLKDDDVEHRVPRRLDL